MIFSESNAGIATLFPTAGGYSRLFHGRVVDMLYFPLFEGRFPQWVPIWGGEDYLFFREVFNIADSSITTGVASLLIFQKKFYTHSSPPQEPVIESAIDSTNEQPVQDSSVNKDF